MSRRRIIKQGHNTLTITLPSKWIKKFNIQPGDEVDVLDHGRGLLVSTEKGPNLTGITIDMSSLPPILIWRFVSSAYRSGYNEIRVVGISSKGSDIYSAFSYNTLDCLKARDISEMSPIETIQAVVNRLIGVDIIDQKEKYCIIKELGETNNKMFENALRRIFLLLKNEAEILKEGMKGNKEGLKSIHIVDTNLDRFEDFCIRVLNKTGYSDFRQTPTMHTLIFILELIGDEFKKLAIHIMEHKKHRSKLINDMFELQFNQLNRLYDLFYVFEKKKTVRMNNANDEWIKFIQKYENKLSSNFEKECLHHFKKIANYIYSLVELRIDLEH